MKKIAVITSTRAEYGLLHPLIRKLIQESEIAVQVLVSGTHLLAKFGKTIDYIIRDGVTVDYTIPIYDDEFVSDEVHAAAAVAKAVELSSSIFAKEGYDAIVVLGDRYEIIGFCMAAAICRIPIIHIHGGEITEGAIDDKIRHAVTKLSSIHFPSIQEYADRIIQMGEAKKYVYPVGALGIDNIMNMQLLDKKSLLEELEIKTDMPLAAVTYHPVTSERPELAVDEIRQVMNALLETGVYSIITMPNSDVGGDNIYKETMNYVSSHGECMTLKKSLGQMKYLSLLKNADVMVGNSSSGILESASFQLPTVNIGNRQKGRMAPKNVIHCLCKKEDIVQAIKTGMSLEFRKTLNGYVNPYGDGHAAERMVEIIKNTDFSDSALICKKFYDIR